MRLIALVLLALIPSVARAACVGTSVDGSTAIVVAAGTTYCVTGDNLAVGDFDLFTGSADNVTIDFQSFKLGHATTSLSREILNLSGAGLTILGDGSGAGTLGSANILSGTATVTGVRFENDDAVAAIPFYSTGAITLNRCEVMVSGISTGYAFRVTGGTLTASDCIFRHTGDQDLCRIDAGSNIDIRGSTFVGTGTTANELIYSRQATTESCIVSGNIFKNFAAARCWFFTTAAFYEGTSGGTISMNNNSVLRSDANADIVSPGTDDLANIPGTGNVSTDPTFTTDTVLGAGVLTAGSAMEDANLTAYAGTLDFYETTRKAVTPTIGAFDFGAGGAPTGACCTATVCTIDTSAGCTGGGGTYQGDSTTCSPDPCAGTTAVCCTDPGGVAFGNGTVLETTCTITTEGACAGDWFSGETTCSPNPCAGDDFQSFRPWAMNSNKLVGDQAMLDRVYLEWSTATKTTKDDVFAAVISQADRYISDYNGGAGDPLSSFYSYFKIMCLVSSAIIQSTTEGTAEGLDDHDLALAVFQSLIAASIADGPDGQIIGSSGAQMPTWSLIYSYFRDDLTETEIDYLFEEYFHNGVDIDATDIATQAPYLWGHGTRAPIYSLRGEIWEQFAMAVALWDLRSHIDGDKMWMYTGLQGFMSSIWDECRGWQEYEVGGARAQRYLGGSFYAVENIQAPEGYDFKGHRHYAQKRYEWLTWLCWMWEHKGIGDEWAQMPNYFENYPLQTAIHRRADGQMSQVGTGATINLDRRTWTGLAMWNAHSPTSNGGKYAAKLLEMGASIPWATANDKYEKATTALFWVEDNASAALPASDFHTTGSPDGIVIGDGTSVSASITVRSPSYDRDFAGTAGNFYAQAELALVNNSDTWVGHNSFVLGYDGDQLLRANYYGELIGQPLSQFPTTVSTSLSQNTMWIADTGYANVTPPDAQDIILKWSEQFHAWDQSYHDTIYPGMVERMEQLQKFDPDEPVLGARYFPVKWTQEALPVVAGVPLAFERSSTLPDIDWYQLNRNVQRFETDYVFWGGSASPTKVIRRWLVDLDPGFRSNFVNNYNLRNEPTMNGSVVDVPVADHIKRHAYADGLQFTSTVNHTFSLAGVWPVTSYDSKMLVYTFTDDDATTKRTVALGGLGVADARSHEAWYYMDPENMVTTGINLIVPEGGAATEHPRLYTEAYNIGMWKEHLQFIDVNSVRQIDLYKVGNVATVDATAPIEITGAALQGIHIVEDGLNIIIPDEVTWTTLTFTTPDPSAGPYDYVIPWADGSSSYDVAVGGTYSQTVATSANAIVFQESSGVITVTASGSPTGACCYRNGACAITFSAGCLAFYRGNGSVCEPNPCHSLSRRISRLALHWQRVR